jgi:phosphotransferase system HPr (HPr) family protein
VTERRVRVTDPAGLHARQAARLVQVAGRFASRISVRQAGREADASSLIGLLGLAVGPSSEVTLVADGPDAEEALRALALALDADQPSADEAGHRDHHRTTTGETDRRLP